MLCCASSRAILIKESVYIAIQLVPSDWLQVAAVGKSLVPIEDPDVIQAEEATLKEVASMEILLVDPPGEVEQQLLEDAFEEGEVSGVIRILFAAKLPINLEDPPAGPSVDRGIGITEVPLVRGQLSVGMQIPDMQKLYQLLLGKFRIDQGEGDRMKRQVP